MAAPISAVFIAMKVINGPILCFVYIYMFNVLFTYICLMYYLHIYVYMYYM